MDRRDHDHHLFHLFAVKHRVLGEHLPNDKPIQDVATLPLSTFLPDASECETFQKELKSSLEESSSNTLPIFRVSQIRFQNISDIVIHGQRS